MKGWTKKRQIMRRYDLTAKMYDARYSGEQTMKYAAALAGLGPISYGKVLDAGCGTGLLFNHICERAEAVIGLDISKKTLHIAKERIKRPSNVHVILADADYAPLKEEMFDTAFAMTLLQNSPNPVETLKEIKRVTKHDANIVATGLKKTFSKKDFQSILKKAGLKIRVWKDEDNLKCYVAACSKINH